MCGLTLEYRFVQQPVDRFEQQHPDHEPGPGRRPAVIAEPVGLFVGLRGATGATVSLRASSSQSQSNSSTSRTSLCSMRTTFFYPPGASGVPPVLRSCTLALIESRGDEAMPPAFPTALGTGVWRDRTGRVYGSCVAIPDRASSPATV